MHQNCVLLHIYVMMSSNWGILPFYPKIMTKCVILERFSLKINMSTCMYHHEIFTECVEHHYTYFMIAHACTHSFHEAFMLKRVGN